MSSVIEEVERCSKLAHTKLRRRDDDNAIKLFKLALQRAKSSSEATLVQKAAVNLGAALVAVRRSREALKILNSSAKSPPSDSALAGDLFYNLALVQEQLGNKHEARKYFKQSFDLYAVEPGCGLLKAGIACKLAALSIELLEFKTAAEAFGEAASLYKSFNLPEQHALCLYQKVLVLEASGSDFEAVTTANDCEVICQGIASDTNVATGRLYNELGLFYAKHKKYDKATDCFKQALSVISSEAKNKKFEAIVLQNLGAIHSCHSDFKQSIEFNKKAAALHAQTGGRNGQGQCFMNIAYAYSQLNDLESAGEYYLHALQANQDSNDRNGEWQALEGLCTVALHQRRLDRCCDYLKRAIIAASADQNLTEFANSSKGSTMGPNMEPVRQRLVNKLTQVLQLRSQEDEVVTHIELDKSPIPKAQRPRRQSSLVSKQEDNVIDNRKAEVKKVDVKVDRRVLPQVQPAVKNPQETPSRSSVELPQLEGGDREEHPDTDRDADAERLQKDYQAMYADKDGDDDGGDEDEEEDDDDEEDSESDSDSDDSNQAITGTSSSVPQYSAPRAPRFDTYVNPAVDDKSPGLQPNNDYIRDPTYMSVTARGPSGTRELQPQSRDPDASIPGRSVSADVPPPLPSRPGDQVQRQSATSENRTETAEELRRSDDVKLPKKAPPTERKASQSCHVM